MYSVPKSSKGKKKVEGEKKTEKDRNLLTPLINEQGHENGKFGWCVSCRKAANLYCKHFRYPVCSFECKQSHIKLLEDAQATSDKVSITAINTPSIKI